MTTLSPRERAAALAVLGLPPQATAGQVTQAYRRLARSAHPDITGLADAATGGRFAAISDAYRRFRAAQASDGTQASDGAAADEAREESPPKPEAHDARRPAGDPRGAWAPRYAAPPLRPGPPIVAGPVMVSPLPPASRTRGGRRRAR